MTRSTSQVVEPSEPTTPHHRRQRKSIVIRSKRLDELDESKLACAIWLMAKKELHERTGTVEPALSKAKDVQPPASADSLDEQLADLRRRHKAIEDQLKRL